MAAAKSGQALIPGSLSDFSGGPNLRDAASELAANELEDAWNVTLDERGGAASRLGYQKRNGTVLGGVSDLIVNDFWSRLAAKWITQSGKSIYLDNATSAVHTFTTADCVTFAETDNKIVAAHPVDGIFTSPDGTTWTLLAGANVPTKPLCVAAWEAKLWVGLADGTVHWSALGDITTWNVNDFNPIWTIDQQPIVNLHVGSGQDIQGRPGLLAFKNESVYRINDPATGAYTVVDATNGCGGPKAVIGVGARVCWIGKRGIFWWREDQAQPVNVSDLLGQLWRDDQLNVSVQAGWCAGRRLNRAYFSLARAGSSVNDTAFEFHPDQGWLVPRSDAMSCYATSSGANEITSGGAPSAHGQCYQLDTGGTDDGAAISWYLQARWIVLNDGFDAYVWLVRIHGRGSGTVTLRANYEDAGGTETPFSLDQAVPNWDSGTFWDTGTFWQVPVLQTTQAIYSIGRCRQFSLRFSGTSTTTAFATQIFASGQQPVVGAFGLFGLEYLFVPLGLS
jgi:hypothetical protein